MECFEATERSYIFVLRYAKCMCYDPGSQISLINAIDLLQIKNIVFIDILLSDLDFI